MKVTDCYPFQDKDYLWCLVKVIDGHREIDAHKFENKDSAIEYGRKRGWIYP